MAYTTSRMKNDDIHFEPEIDDAESAASKDPQAAIKKLKDKLKVCERERKEYLEGWQRMKADLANYKKDDEKRLSAMREYAAESLIAELLAVEESFQMAFSNKDAWEKVEQNWRVGVEYIHSQFLEVLKKRGLSIIDPLGQAFNPREHHSVGSIPTENPKEDHHVLEVVKKGYTLGERVIKAAEVRIGTHSTK